MRAVHHDFRLYDGDKPGFLRQGGVPCQRVRVGGDAVVAGQIVAIGAGVDVDDRPPLGEARAYLGVLGKPVAQTVKPFGDHLARRGG